jgi:hypothetical protein
MRQFAPKVELLTPDAQHLRWINGALAQALVEAETAAVSNANGRIKSIQLTARIEALALRVGPATPLTATSFGVRFVRRVQSEAGTYFEHHPRATDYGE